MLGFDAIDSGQVRIENHSVPANRPDEVADLVRDRLFAHFAPLMAGQAERTTEWVKVGPSGMRVKVKPA
jgi:hypothetical protein